MATESFEQDMILDTPEAVERFVALIESGVTYRGSNTKLRLAHADDPIVQALMARFAEEENQEDTDNGNRVV